MLWGGVVLAGGDGGHVHAVHGPYGCVAAVKMAAVGATSHVVWTFTYTVYIPANTREKKYVDPLCAVTFLFGYETHFIFIAYLIFSITSCHFLCHFNNVCVLCIN